MKVYAVCKHGVEYDDEFHSFTEGADPVRVFASKENAVKECEKLNEKFNDNDFYTNERTYDEEADEKTWARLKDGFKVVELELDDSDVDTSYSDKLKKAEKYKKEARELVRSDFTDKAAKLFEKYPGLESFGWTQYTPYFNDGDTCHFSVHADEPYINGKRSYDIEECDNDMCSAVASLVYSYSEGDLEYMFDDHVKITVNRDLSIKTNRYDHD